MDWKDGMDYGIAGKAISYAQKHLLKLIRYACNLNKGV